MRLNETTRKSCLEAVDKIKGGERRGKGGKTGGRPSVTVAVAGAVRTIFHFLSFSKRKNNDWISRKGKECGLNE